jgi:hypothetical protein
MIMIPRLTPAAMREPAVRYALGALVVAVVLLGVAAVGAIRVEQVEASVPPPTIADSALRFRIPGEGADVAAAVAKDLFTDDRQAPPRRYLMPGASEVEAQPAPRPAVLGTALGGADGDFAICQVAGGPSRVVRVGGKVGEFTVVGIERGKVTFRGPDGERFTIDASKPVP